MGTDSLGKLRPQSRTHKVLQFYVLIVTAVEHEFLHTCSNRQERQQKEQGNVANAKKVFTYANVKVLYVISSAWHVI